MKTWQETRKTGAAASIVEATAELKLILAECRKIMGDKEPGSEVAEGLSDATGKIEAAIALLQTDQAIPEFGTPPLDIEKPARELPACSVSGCGNAAGAVVDGALVCGLHASQALLHRRRT